MHNFLFSVTRLSTGKKEGALVFGADDAMGACELACTFARLKNGRACVGPTNCCVYPAGPESDVVWVLVKEKDGSDSKSRRAIAARPSAR